MSIDRYLEELSKAEESLDYWITGSILEFVNSLQAILNEDGLRRRDLADRTGKSEPTVSKAFRLNGNLTVKMMNELAEAVGAAVHVHVERRGIRGRWARADALADQGAASLVPQGARHVEPDADTFRLDDGTPEFSAAPFRPATSGAIQ